MRWEAAPGRGPRARPRAGSDRARARWSPGPRDRPGPHGQAATRERRCEQTDCGSATEGRRNRRGRTLAFVTALQAAASLPPFPAECGFAWLHFACHSSSGTGRQVQRNRAVRAPGSGANSRKNTSRREPLRADFISTASASPLWDGTDGGGEAVGAARGAAAATLSPVSSPAVPSPTAAVPAAAAAASFLLVAGLGRSSAPLRAFLRPQSRSIWSFNNSSCTCRLHTGHCTSLDVGAVDSLLRFVAGLPARRRSNAFRAIARHKCSPAALNPQAEQLGTLLSAEWRCRQAVHRCSLGADQPPTHNACTSRCCPTAAAAAGPRWAESSSAASARRQR